MDEESVGLRLLIDDPVHRRLIDRTEVPATLFDELGFLYTNFARFLIPQGDLSS